MRPEISVVIPSYQRPRETAHAVRSALGQTGVQTEVIVIDDGSPLPLEIPPRLLDAGSVRIIRHVENGGPAAARNTGVAASRGDYIAFLDSDDFFVPDTLAPRLAHARQSECPSRPTLCTAGVVWWSPGRFARTMIPKGASDLRTLVAGCWYFPGSTALLSRTTWETVGKYDAKLRRLEDLDWGIRLALAGGALVVWPVAAAVVRRSGPAKSALVDAATARLLNRFGPGGDRQLDPEPYRRLRAYLALERAKSALGERHYSSVARHLLLSFRLKPRLSLHQRPWWSQRTATDREFAALEELARADES